MVIPSRYRETQQYYKWTLLQYRIVVEWSKEVVSYVWGGEG